MQPATGEQPDAPTEPEPVAPQVLFDGYAPPRPRPAVVSRGDALSALVVAAVIAVLGVPLGWLWSRLAPGQLSIVQEDGTLAALPTQSQHRFDDLATFVLLGAVAGLLAGLAVWFLRSRRGPLALAGLAVGCLVGAWIAARTGVWFAGNHYPVTQASTGDVVVAAPRLDSAWVVFVQPLLAVIVYATAAAANGLEDLGRS